MKGALILCLILLSCDGGGDDEDFEDRLPSNSTSECDGNVTFETVVPDVAAETEEEVTEEVLGIGNPAVSRALRLAGEQGLEVVRLEKVEGATIIATCGSTINIGGDTEVTTTVPVSE